MSRRLTITLLIIVAMIVPFPTTVVPIWRLKVVDVNGNFCPNKEVDESWKHYSIELGGGGGGNDTRLTDDEGYVEFPERTIWAPLIWRIIGAIIANALLIAHGGAGVHANVYSSGLKDVAWISYKPDKPLPDKIVVHSCVYNGGS